jgi:TPR repeat protein
MEKNLVQASDLHDRAHKAFEAGNSAEGFKLAVQAVATGDTTALHTVAYCFDVGEGVEINKEKAIHFYKKSLILNAESKSGSATNIGLIYKEKGNLRQAKYWFKKSIKYGDAEAGLELMKIISLRTKRQKTFAMRLIQNVMNADTKFVTELGRAEAHDWYMRLLAAE